jgi:hypothetical protein
MIGSIDLVLATLERALTVTVLPAAADADAKQEAALGALFARWLRDVVDHAGDIERASAADAGRTLGEIAAFASRAPLGAASRAALDDARALGEESPPETVAAVRDFVRRAKTALGKALHAARADGDRDLARAVRRILGDFAGREIERDLSFARATGMDPDAAGVTPLAELLRRQENRRA